WNTNKLVHRSVPSPEFLYFGSSDPFTHHPYILMEWVDGVRMEEIILDLSGKDVESLGNSVGSTLASIHSFKFEYAGFFDPELNVVERIELGGAGLIEYAERCLAGIGSERLGSPLAGRVVDFLKSHANLLDDWHGRPCLSHSDFGGSNILVKNAHGEWIVAAVLDWEFAFSGSPFFDVGNLLRAPHGTVPGFEAAVFSSYKSNGGELPDTWREMSLLTDLTAWLEFMTRPDPGDHLIADAQRIISETIERVSD
ncbi:MAG TPA: phosphotransferase, partial [Chroococcales cyanobacterium]